MLMSSKINVLRIYWRLSTNLKATKKCNVFWYVTVCIFWNVFNVYSIGYTLRQNTNVETISFGQNKWYKKMPFFFLSRAPTHHSFTFNLWFLYDLNSKFCLSKDVGGTFYFQFHFVFINNLYFCSTKCVDSLTLERHNSFQN